MLKRSHRQPIPRTKKYFDSGLTYYGYSGSLNKEKRYKLLEVQSLLQLFSLKNFDDLVEHRQLLIKSAILKNLYLFVRAKCTESVAVERPSFSERIQKRERLKFERTKNWEGRKFFCIKRRKARLSYKPHSATKTSILRHNSSIYRDIMLLLSII